MSVTDAIHRGNNLLATSIVALSGFAFGPEILLEDDVVDKIDDVLLLVLGIIAIVWYKKGNNRFTRSVVPVVLVVASLIVKIIAIVIEHGDKEAVGDDFGALVLFVLSTALVTFIYRSSKKLVKS